MVIIDKTFTYHKVVYELRFLRGLSYLDRCGEAINQIIDAAPEWLLRGKTPNADIAPLVSMKNGAEFNLTPSKLDLSLEQGSEGGPLSYDQIMVVTGQAGLLTAIVMRELGLEEFTRTGFRIWWLCGFENQNEARRWVNALPVLGVSRTLSSALSGELETLGLSYVVKSEDRMFRVAINAVEKAEELELHNRTLTVDPKTLRQGQKDLFLRQLKEAKKRREAPDHAAMIDVDAYIENPMVIEPERFIKENLDRLEHSLPAGLGRRA